MNNLYHSKAAHDSRLRVRRADLKAPQSLKAFYHVACMGNWKEVFLDQCNLLAEVGLFPEAHVLGTLEDFKWVKEHLPAYHWGGDVKQYETPTLQALQDWCNRHPESSVLYFHTKGVSQPRNLGKQAWRILMEEALIRNWKVNLACLATFDFVGVNWMNNPDYPHYCGNFWMARADWLISLPTPKRYRSMGGPWVGGNPWERMHAELWLGCRPWHHRRSLICEDMDLWTGNNARWLLDSQGQERMKHFMNRTKTN